MTGEQQGVPHPTARESSKTEHRDGREFGELLRYTAAGYVAGLAAGALLDRAGLHRSGLGQWLVRTLAGEGESIFEGVFALRKRLRGAAGSLAEAYGWGKLIGLAAPWAVDALSRLAGVDVSGTGGFYVPYFYAMSDQIGANVSGLVYLRRRAGGWGAAVRSYCRNAVMLSSLAIVLLVPLGLLAVRVGGFRPSTQVSTAIEQIAANLCWLPPLIGWLGRSRRR